MRPKTLLLLTSVLVLLASSVVTATDAEEEFINKFMSRLEKKHTTKVTWISGSFSINRINRDNDYNKFANYETVNFTDGAVSWLGEAPIMGLDFGMVFSKRFAWRLSGEYWMPMGETLEGTYFYEPTGTYIENPTTEVKVYGITTGLDYYLMNPPKVTGELNDLAIRAGVGVGFYKASWDVWEEYQNLNLATDMSDGSTASFEDQGVGFSMHLGVDYPTRIFNLVLGVDLGYLYLNLDNVAYYNSHDEEIIASYSGDADGRVDLGLSGVKGKIEIKHFFSW